MPVIYAIEVVLALAAVVSCLKTPTQEMPNGFPKPLCLLLIIILPLIGPIAWFVITWASRAEKSSPDGSISLPKNPGEFFGSFRAPEKTSEPVPPDDNPEFLWRIEAQMRREKMAKQAEQAKRQQQEKSAASKAEPDASANHSPSNPEPSGQPEQFENGQSSPPAPPADNPSPTPDSSQQSGSDQPDSDPVSDQNGKPSEGSAQD